MEHIYKSNLSIAVEHLCYLLRESFFESSLKGTCYIRFLKKTHENIYIEIDGPNIFIGNDYKSFRPTSFVTVKDSSIILKWSDSPHLITFRAPEMSFYFDVSGDIKLIQTLVNLIRRPPFEVLKQVQFIQNKCENYINKVFQVKKIEGYDRDIVYKYLKKYLPILCCKALQYEKIIKYSKESLLEKYGDIDIKFNIIKKRNMKLKEFLEPNNNCYSQGCIIPKELEMICTFSFLRNLKNPIFQLWSGTRNDGKPLTALHMDVDHSFLAQVYGKKEIILYSPDQSKYLYPQKGMLYSQACFVDSHDPDFKIHPNFKLSKQIRVEIESGDVLIIPATWFHVVYAKEPVFSYSTFIDQKTLEAQLW